MKLIILLLLLVTCNSFAVATINGNSILGNTINSNKLDAATRSLLGGAASSGLTPLQSTNAAKQQASFVTNNIFITITNAAITQAELTTNGLFLTITNSAAQQASFVTNGLFLIITNAASQQAYFVTNGLFATITNAAITQSAFATNGIFTTITNAAITQASFVTNGIFTTITNAAITRSSFVTNGIFTVITNAAITQASLTTNGIFTTMTNTVTSTASTNVLTGVTLNIVNASNVTNQWQAQASDYVMTVTNSRIALAGNKKITMPAPNSCIGHTFIIQCDSAGTNAILPNSAEVFKGAGTITATKWTNSVLGRSTWLESDGTNWRVIKTDN